MKNVIECLNIPLGRRIAEIMKEKGSAYSLQAMGKRLCLSRETLRLMLKGDRNIYDYERKNIAADLKLSVERITQEDTLALRDELEKQRSKEHKDWERMLNLSRQLGEKALGVTERTCALLLIGQSHAMLVQHKQAHDCFDEAYRLSQEIQDKYGESDLLHHAASFLITSYTIQKKFTQGNQLLAQVEAVLEQRPEKAAGLAYHRAKILESFGELEAARQMTCHLLELCRRWNSRPNIGRAFINIAHFDTMLGNYATAVELLAESLDYLEGDRMIWLIAVKELTRNLLELGDNAQAEEFARQAFAELERTEFPRVEAELSVLWSRLTNDPTAAVGIVEAEKYDLKERHAAGKYLIQHYKAQGDDERWGHYQTRTTALLQEMMRSV
jgi:hypothetical protein